MSNIERAFLISTEPVTDSASVNDFATSMGAESFPHVDGFCKQTLTDQAREEAIKRAAALVEYLHAVYRAYEALWHKHGDFTAKAAFDLALSDCHKAREIMESLIKGRSAAQIARMERERGLDLPACANEERSA